MADETAAIMLGLTIQENDKITISMDSMPVIHSNVPSFTMNAEKKNDDGVVNNQEVAEDNGSTDVKEEDADREDANGATTAANDDSHAGDNIPTTNNNNNNNETNNAANIETPLSTPRRRIKKRREDGFVYAEDTKAEKSSAPDSNKQPPLEQLAPTIFKPPPIVPSSTTTTKLPTKPPPPRKRPRKCPAKDSILIEVPLSVTADLGVAMRRTRRKRIKRIKEWVASGAKAAAAASAESESNKKSSPKDENDDTKKSAGGGDKEEKVASKSSALDEEEDELEDSDGDGGPLHRKQYGSVLDYLEAKYVRGVMIEDYDERERSKEKKKSSAENENGSKEEEEESDDSEGKGSCYDSDGWIDDTGLHEEVAGQVMASSAYGMTQIENEARRRKLEKREREKSTTENGDEKGIELEGAGMEEEEKQSDADDRSEEGGADSDFDDGFFVNLGDLEMAEGWKGENDFSFTAKKKKVKKRAYNKKTKADKSDKATGAKSKTVKKKNINVKAAAPGAKKKLPKKPKEKKAKEDGKTETKKKGGKAKKSDDKSKKSGDKPKKSDDKSKKSDEKSSKSEDKSTPPKKKKKKAAVLESATSPDNNEGEAAAEKESAKKSTAAAPASDKDSKTEKSASPKEKKKAPEMSKEKEKAIQLRKVYKKKYNGCVKMMKDMTSEELPKKQKKKSVMMKVSVNIPPDKSIGDEITFGNPNVPGQKLKVKIPKKADMEKRNFVVSVPGPKVKAPELRENNFAKEFKEALYNFACSYDDWCAAEGEHNDSLPASKRKQFKPNTEKLKKFDELITEFPKNLVTPIDVSYLRKIVRQERSNKSRREKRKDCGGSSVADGKGEWTDQPLQETEINIPQKGMDFEDIVFCRQDFEGK